MDVYPFPMLLPTPKGRTRDPSRFAALVAACIALSCGDEAGGVCVSDGECPGGHCSGGRCFPGTGRDGGRPMDSGLDAGVTTTCVDLDRDGRGEGCAAGPDCDDGNPIQTGTERCDDADNDCDTTIDEGVRSPCGNCDASCRQGGIGTGGRPAWDPEGDPSEGVGVSDDDGALILDSRNFDTHVIWLADTALGTVTKVDTRTLLPVARYRVGPETTSPDPSRTSVNSLGDVYVGSRGGRAVTRISVLGEACADRNEDGFVNTSTGVDDVKPWPSGEPVGEDECILWRTDLGGAYPDTSLVRAVAAQDLYGPDDELIPYVWIGDYDGRHVWKLDGVTGDVLFRTEAPVSPYGFALDGLGNLWMIESGSQLGRLDTNRCVDVDSCIDPVCDGAAGDECVKQRIQAPRATYGITVDAAQRVWTGGTVQRYTHDPGILPIEDRWVIAGEPGDEPSYTYGIAADRRGWVWAAISGGRTLRVNQEDLTEWTEVLGTGPSCKGMAVDIDGNVWCVSEQGDGRAYVISPGELLEDYIVTPDVATLTSSSRYTYSDMTGEQLRLATNPRGTYAHVFEGCPDDPQFEGTVWHQLAWDADVPPQTMLRFRVRTADTREALELLDWLTIAEVAPATSPVDVAEILRLNSIVSGRFMELEIQLTTERTMGMSTPITPRVRSVDLQFLCPTTIG